MFRLPAGAAGKAWPWRVHPGGLPKARFLRDDGPERGAPLRDVVLPLGAGAGSEMLWRRVQELANATKKPDLAWRVFRWLNRRWAWVAGASAVVGAVALGGMGLALEAPGWADAFLAAAGALLGAAVSSAAAVGIYLLLRLERRVEDAEAEVRALVNIRPLTDLPLDLHGYAADPVLAEVIAREIFRLRPEFVVECGSGWSTFVASACLEALGRGRVVSLEHLERYAEEARDRLAAAGLTRAEIVHAPIADRALEGETWPWYGEVEGRAIQGSIDLLIVDGPPGDLGPRARYPAVPLMRSRLGDGCVVILDDGYRDEEAWIAARWAENLGMNAELIRRGSGVWVLAAP